MILGSLLIGGPMVMTQAFRPAPDPSIWIPGVIAVLASPLMYAWNLLEERRSDRRQFREEEAAFRAEVAAAAAQLSAARAREIEWRNRTFPAPAELLERVRTHAATIWERRPDHSDYLRLRVGAADRATAATFDLEESGSRSLRDEARTELQRHKALPRVPVDLPLNEIRSVGIAGAEGDVAALARWMVAQAAALHSPRDLAIAAVIASDNVRDWDWLKWLPHCSGEGSPLRVGHLSTDAESTRGLMEAVLAVIRQRSLEGDRSRHPRGRSSLLLLIDGRAGVDRAIGSRILEAQPDLGISTIWLGRHVQDLPGGCRSVLQIADLPARIAGGLASLDVTGHEEKAADIMPDRLSSEDARSLALSLASLRDVSADTAAATIPRTVTLFELLGVDTPTEDFILAQWGLAQDDAAAPIGRTATSQFVIDLRRDGPHGLIAGTTGSGKSELLQTIIASLAARYRPDRLSFLLVDYKGGSAFRDCVALPHTLGIVTDLDEHLAHRALISLEAELKRRERILASAGAKDLTMMTRVEPTRAPARLLIVIDEFAALVREVPRFVDGIIDIAQRGRSLGVHLLLATQRPAGVVTAPIRANTNLRIALRVADPSESEDVIRGPEASMIARDLPGRAFARIGHDQLLEFQAAYAGAAAEAERDAPVVIRDFTMRDAEREAARSIAGPGEPVTQLKKLVDVIAEASTSAGVPGQPAPWLPPLAEVVPLRALASDAISPSAPTAALGLLDDPARQQQRPAEFDLARDGSLLVYGTSGSGKTTLLRTIAVSLAQRLSPAMLNLYGLDMSTGGLKALEALPHCGSVIVGTDEERTARLFSMLRSTVESRRRVLAEAGVSAIGELPEPERVRFPRLLVLLNGYGAFASTYERSAADLVDSLARVVADGRAAGIHFVIAAERRGSVPGPLAGVIQRRVVLRMSDEDEYASLGLSRKQYEKVQMPPGRGFHEGLDLQCAVVGDDDSARAQTEAILRIGEDIRRRHPTANVWRVELLPERIDASALPPATEPFEAIIGIQDRDLGPARVALSDSNFVILGPYRSGRSTALLTLVHALRRGDSEHMFILLAPRPTPLTQADCWATVAQGPEQCRTLAASFVNSGGASGSTVLVIDNGEDLLDDEDSESLAALVRRTRGTDLRVVAAIERQAARGAYRGWFAEIRKDGSALLLQPDLESDGDLFGVRLRRGVVSLMVPGRGYLLRRGSAELIQVALPDQTARADVV